MESETSKPSGSTSSFMSIQLDSSMASMKNSVMDNANNSSMAVDSANGSNTNLSLKSSIIDRSFATATTNGCSSSGAVTKCPMESSSSGAVGEQFLMLAKSAKGAAAVQLIKEALEAPGLYVFAELLHMPNIQELSTVPEHSAYYRLVEVFAYGVYDDYLSSNPPLPPLTPIMLTKLRHLTIVTMADSEKSLPLDNLVEKLALNSRRELEDLIIEAIYADVLHGKLDQRDGVLEVDYAVGRDIKAEDLPHIATTLRAWCDTCNGLLGTLEGLVNSANKEKEASIRRTNGIEAEITKIKSTYKRQSQGGSASEVSAAVADDGICSPADIIDKKLHRLNKKSSSSQAGGSGIAKSSAKFWPKS
uniref:COP9 signalosome complex subunit 7a-like n=1 Tax=Hirondellea gigas TaxID=1518452 RepID=A0A2P2I0U4_9CRUS